MFGGGLDVKYWAMSKEQRVRKVDWRVAMIIGGAIFTDGEDCWVDKPRKELKSRC